MILKGVTAQIKSPASAFGVCRVFLFVDKRFRISNHEIIRDMDRIIILEEIISIIE